MSAILSLINKWYGQSSNQLALGSLIASVNAYFSHQLNFQTLLGVIAGFFVVALKNQTNQTTTPLNTQTASNMGKALTIILFVGVGGTTLMGCTPTQQTTLTKDLGTPAGQLFCQLETATGPTVVGLIDAQATAANVTIGGLGPVAVFATNALAADVQNDCKLAAAAVNAKTGVPVSPPNTAVGTVAITPVHTTTTTTTTPAP